MDFIRINDNTDDLDIAIGVYNSNPIFLMHHLGRSSVDKTFILDEINDMKDQGFSSYFIVDNKKVIGLIDYRIQDDGYVYLSMLMIASPYQNEGKGMGAYQDFEMRVSDKGVKKIRIDVVDDYSNNTRPFWEKMGFLPQYEDKLTWHDKQSQIVVMEKQLY